MTPDTNKERAAFEAWYFVENDSRLFCETQWRAWQARAAKAPAAPGFQQALDIRTAQGWKLGGDKVPVLYTDSINGQQVCRDDVWLCATAAFAVPPAAEPVAEVKELFIPATGATAKAAHLMDTSLPGGTMLYTAPPAPTEQWRDIETAPQDGTRVILAEAEKVFHGGFVGVQFKEHRDADGNYLDQTDADAYWMNFEEGDVCHPTHWQPEPALPAPPQGAAK